jgi:multicomponent Na+:H+ antiporter subunit E
MSSNRRPRATWLVGGAALLGVWVLLWEDLSVANVVSGILVVVAVFALLNRPFAEDDERLHLIAAVHLAGWFVWQLVVASTVVAWEVLTPTQRARQGILEIELRTESPRVAALVANIISLIPGTLTLEAVTDPMRLYVHVLHLKDADAVKADVARLEDLVTRALAPSTMPAPPITHDQEGSHR